VEGDDAVNKIVILARLAFGAWLAPADVLASPPTLRGTGRRGVTGVIAAEVAAAGTLGLVLKLIARAEIGPDGRPWASVLPSAVDRDGPLGRTDGVLNRIEVAAEPVGSVAFSGPGAGGDATSSAVLGDLIAIARGQGSTWAGLAPATAVRPPAPEAGATASIEGNETRGADPAGLAGARAWFAFLPGVTAAALRNRAGDALDAAADIAGGTAVRTKPITLAAARAALTECAAVAEAPAALAPRAALAQPADVTGAADVTLYPVVD
jgi:homoserine dehydrogenase